MSILDKAILKSEILKKNNIKYEPQKAINIAFGVDANFARPMGVAMTSIILNNRNQNIIFHIFTDGLNECDKIRLKLLAEINHIIIKIYYIDISIFKNLKTTTNWSVATYYRFIMCKGLYGEVEKVLYLDADIICLKQIQELFNIDMNGKTIMAVHDIIDSYNFPIRMKKINIKSGNYFNAGVLLIDINKWNEKNISERAFELLLNNMEKYDYLDQDVLNVTLENDVCFINKNYNYIYNKEQSQKDNLVDVIKLLHYATVQKPWYTWYNYPLGESFIKYASQSPWKDVPLLDQPRNYKEMKMMSKTMKQRGNFKGMLIWYWRYCINKIIQ